MKILGKTIFLLLTPLSLAGCVSAEVLNSSSSVVVVKAALNDAASAQAAANTECSKYRKTARLHNIVRGNNVWGSFFFDCE
jgi:hypothetical protein